MTAEQIAYQGAKAAGSVFLMLKCITWISASQPITQFPLGKRLKLIQRRFIIIIGPKRGKSRATYFEKRNADSADVQKLALHDVIINRDVESCSAKATRELQTRKTLKTRETCSARDA